MDNSGESPKGASEQAVAPISADVSTTSENGNTIIAQLTNVNQDLDDFRTDSKWADFTPLEKASYDCSDMYLDSAQPEEEQQQSFAQPADQNNQQDISSYREDSHINQSETHSEVSKSHSEQPETSEQKQKPESPHQVEQQSSPPKSPIEESGATVVEQPNTEKSESKPDKIDSKLQQSHTIQRDDGPFNSCILESSSVDAQMEKVIDNLVESGGCQQFVQALEHQQSSTLDNSALEKVVQVKPGSITGEPQDIPGADEEKLDKVVQPNTDNLPVAEDTPSVEENTDEEPSTEETNTEATKENVIVAEVDSADEEEQTETKDEAHHATTTTHDDKVVEEEESGSLEEIPTSSTPDKDDLTEEPKSCPLATSTTEDNESDVEMTQPAFTKDDEAPMDATDVSKDNVEEQEETTMIVQEVEEVKSSRKLRGRRSSARQATPKLPKIKFERRPSRRVEPETPPSAKPQEESPSKIETISSRRSKVTKPPPKPIEPYLVSKTPKKLSPALPTPSNRKSAPILVKFHTKKNLAHDGESIERKYTCKQCGFSTDRLNNIVYHHKHIFLCKGGQKLHEAMVEQWKHSPEFAKSNKRRGHKQ